MALVILLAGLPAAAQPGDDEVREIAAAVAEAGPPPDGFQRAVAPHLALTRQAVRRGEWPLWNDRAGAGYPLLGTADGQLLHPFSLLLYPLPRVAWLPVLAWLRIAAGMLLAAALLRRLRLAKPAVALGAGLHAVACAALAAHPLGTYAALAPGLLLAAVAVGESGAAPPGRRLRLGAFLAFCGVFAGGDPMAIQLAAAAGLAAFVASAAGAPSTLRRARLGRFLAAAGLAALATAPILAATFGWRGWDHLGRRFNDHRRPRLVGDPLELERGFGITTRDLELDLLRGPGTGWLIGLGAALALLAFAAWWLRRRGEPARQDGRRGGLPAAGFFTALGAVALLEVARPPLVSSLLDYYHLPPAPDLVRAHGLPWLLVALATLAALVADRGLRLRRPAGDAGGAGAAAWASWSGRRLLAAGAVLSFVLTLVPVLRHPLAPAWPRPDLVKRLQELQAAHGHSRVAAVGPLLPAETLGAHGLSDARGTLLHLPAGYLDVVGELMVPPVAAPRAVLDRREAALTTAHDRLYQLLGVRWMVTGPRPPGGGPPGRAAAEFPGATIWELGGALPVLFLPQRVLSRPPAEGWRRWVRVNPDFRRRALAQPPPPAVLEQPQRAAATSALDADRDRLTVGHLAATRVDAVLTADRRRLVASSVYQDGGWRALSAPAGAAAEGGRPVTPRAVPTVLANGPFVAVWRPPGTHRLTLLYRPTGFVPALAAAGVGLALAVAWLLPAPRRREAGCGGGRSRARFVHQLSAPGEAAR